MEAFNATKQKIDYFVGKTLNISEDDGPIGSNEYYQNAVLAEVVEFHENHSILQTQDTVALLDRFVGNYPYLKLYQGAALQGVNVIDFMVNLPKTFDAYPIIEKMIPKFWLDEESIENWQEKIGYHGFIRQILSAKSVYNASRNECVGLNELLSTELYSFNEVDLIMRVHKEETYRKQLQLSLDTLRTRDGVVETIVGFENYSQKNENLLQHVFAYSINMNRLRLLRGLEFLDNKSYLEEILKTDLFALAGDILFDEIDIPIQDIELIVCHLNTNLLHVITTTTCPTISIRDKFSSSPNDDFNEILQLLAKDVNAVRNYQLRMRSKSAQRKPSKIDRHDIFQYVREHNELITYLLMEVQGYRPCDSLEEIPIDLNRTILENIMQMEELAVHLESDTDDVRMLAALNFDSFGLDVIRELIVKEKFR